MYNYAADEARYTPDAMCRKWAIKYPDEAGDIDDSYCELLILSGDGSYSWTPPPEWAAETGRWWVTRHWPDNLVLTFQPEHKPAQGHFVVPIRYKKDGPVHLNWQRTRGDAVLFDDRIWRADPLASDYS